MKIVPQEDDKGGLSVFLKTTEVDNKWRKMRKIFDQAREEEGNQFVLFSVPKGFDVEQLNTL